MIYFNLLAFPHNICSKNAQTSTDSCFHTPPFSCTYSQVFLVGGEGIKYCSSLECTIDGWIYILYENQKWNKKQRLSSCSDHLVQYCTKKWIKGQKLLSKDKCRSWALALVTWSSFTKWDKKKPTRAVQAWLFIVKLSYSFQLKKKWKMKTGVTRESLYDIYLSRFKWTHLNRSGYESGDGMKIEHFFYLNI